MRRKTLGTTGLVAAVGLIAAGCATDDAEYSTYEHSTTISESAGAAPQAQLAGDEMVIPLHEEQLKVGKRSIDSGQVTIRKTVTSETVSEPVELRRENVVIERRAAGTDAAGTASASGIGAPFQEGAVTIQLQAEEPVVETTIVKTGEVVARKNVEWDRQTVQRDIRREDVAVDRAGAGQINEAAGAEPESAPGQEPQE